MSGHSKWATIKHKKAKTDVARGKAFSKLIKEITTAARTGGGDPDANPRLRTAVESAKAINMPADNIERAIKKGTGELPGVTYEEVTYEGYGPGGVAIMVKSLTDNKNRSTAAVRHVFDKYGGSMGTAGCVSWQFKPRGLIVIPKDKASEDAVLNAALEAGADDVQADDAGYSVVTAIDSFEAVKQKLKENGIEWLSAELTQIASNTVPVSEKNAPKVLRLMEMLEDLDEVQQVYANFDIPDEVLDKVSGA
ncbi:YebC/PmpR family DNA-binding transcriptional regulator [candidate division WOR-3 bacterium JGI_Cruoil_03_51_56]|uniref:Probable transcriptional regulatory protein CH330_08965 n=1 Tax=candidate division WOR-3 bacterium JGI_Cruoil_03_51_56 TaxID=1973747 RepID=A0A235BRH9_UNCW3|nr:MAG: YebC/PmpR family DNA-binding transcriptional regulator [candidate division WOR-3 bacterium JGI_Cruoil_03_51_56]